MLNYGDRSRASDATNPIADTRAGAEEMYRSFTIKNFRCFDELTVEGMGRINLIAGKNNVGKTALLEALWVHSGGPAFAHRLLLLDTFRGLGSIDPIHTLNHLFYSFDNSNGICLSAYGDWEGDMRSLSIRAEGIDTVEIPFDISEEEIAKPDRPIPEKQLTVQYSDESGKKAFSKARIVESKDQPGQWTISATRVLENLYLSSNCHYLLSTGRGSRSDDARRYGELEIHRNHSEVLGILQQIEPHLKGLSVISSDRSPAIYADVGVGQLVPVQLMGDGMSRILSLALAIATAPGGIVLVDEIENGIHHSVMEKVWRAIGAFARSYDVQLFATTHSYECIGAAYRAFEADEEDELRLFRIQRNRAGGFKAVKYDKELMGTALEVRMEMI